MTTGMLGAILVVAAMGASLGAWYVGEAMLDYYAPSEEARRQQFDFSRLNAEKLVADTKNAAIAYGAMGALLGGLVGLLAGLAAGSPVRALLGAGVGVVVAGGVGAAAAYPLIGIYTHYFDPAESMFVLLLLVRGVFWAALGAGVGLAMGVALNWPGSRVLLAIFGGLVGGFLGAVAFEVVCSVVLPLARNDQVIPVATFDEELRTFKMVRLGARIFGAVFVVLGALLSSRPNPKST